jgi:endonuclease YncB( thermonuclease family)
MKSLRTSLSVLVLTLSVGVSAIAQTLIFQGRVVSVANGDAVSVLTPSNTEFQVRCRGIVAPKTESDFASQSQQRLTDLLLDQAVTVRYHQRDPDGKLIGTVLWNGRDVCLDQLRAGMAQYDDQSEQNRTTQRQYASAESSARSNHIGLWSADSLRTNDSPGSAGSSSPSTSVPETVLSQPRATSTASNPDEASSGTIVNVRGYFKKNGTYVAGHKRTAPDGNFNNNWSTQGNVNPYTGKDGTKRPSRWTTAFKWIGIGAALGALIYLDAKYPSATATARCNDGSYSYSQHRQGTCSHQGGVWYWLR